MKASLKRFKSILFFYSFKRDKVAIVSFIILVIFLY